MICHASLVRYDSYYRTYTSCVEKQLFSIWMLLLLCLESFLLLFISGCLYSLQERWSSQHLLYNRSPSYIIMMYHIRWDELVRCSADYGSFIPQLRQEKVELEQTLEQEQECLVNKLMRKIEKLETETAAKQNDLETLRREKVSSQWFLGFKLLYSNVFFSILSSVQRELCLQLVFRWLYDTCKSKQSKLFYLKLLKMYP